MFELQKQIICSQSHLCLECYRLVAIFIIVKFYYCTESFITSAMSKQDILFNFWSSIFFVQMWKSHDSKQRVASFVAENVNILGAPGCIWIQGCRGLELLVGGMLGSLSCLMQRCGFDPPLGRIFPVEGIFPLTPFPPKALSDESLNWGLFCAHMHSITWTQKILTFVS